MCAYAEELQKWLEQKFAVGKLDTALIVLTSFSGTAFAIGNSVFGKELIAYLLPLYFIGWMMPILSGYFIGAVVRNNLVDRMRGWLYLLAGTPAYLTSPLIGLYLPLWSFYQLNPMNAVKSVFLFAFFHMVIVSIATMISFCIVEKLFSNASLQEDEGKIQKRSIALTSMAVALFTGSIGSFHIWSSFGITIQLILGTAAIFLLGFLFEYLALLTTRSRVHLENSEQLLIQHETTSDQESRKSVVKSAKTSRKRVPRLLMALFLISGFIFLATNISTLLVNYQLLPAALSAWLTVTEVIGLLMSTAGLYIMVYCALYRKPELDRIFPKIDASKRLSLKVEYIVLATVNTLLGAATQKSLIFAWVLISLAFFYILFSIDEYVEGME